MTRKSFLKSLYLGVGLLLAETLPFTKGQSDTKVTLKKTFRLKSGDSIDPVALDNYIFQFLDEEQTRKVNDKLCKVGKIKKFSRENKEKEITFYITFKDQEEFLNYKDLSFKLNSNMSAFMSGPYTVENKLI